RRRTPAAGRGGGRPGCPAVGGDALLRAPWLSGGRAQRRSAPRRRRGGEDRHPRGGPHRPCRGHHRLRAARRDVPAGGRGRQLPPGRDRGGAARRGAAGGAEGGVGAGPRRQEAAARRGRGPLQRDRGAPARVSATIIDGSAVARAIRSEIASEVAAMVTEGLAAPHLAVVLCGDDPASATYVRNKSRAAERAGIRFTLHTPNGESSTAEILGLCARLSGDPD